MVQLSTEGGNLIAEIQGAHKIWACKSRLEIPLQHIIGVTVRPDDAGHWWHGWKVLGTDLPGAFAAGLFRLGGKWVFWDVKDPSSTIEIDLQSEHLDRLLLEVEDPEGAAAQIRTWIGSPA